MKKDFKAYANSCITLRSGAKIYAIESVNDIIYQLASRTNYLNLRSSNYNSKPISIKKTSILKYRSV